MTPLEQQQGIFLGTSAWTHKDWIGNFYPPNCSPRNYLVEYAKRLPTVEIDSTFYAIPKVTTVKGWKAKTDDRFVFAAKFPQLITHERRLIDCQDEVTMFLDVMTYLDAKLGPLLLQFPPGFRIESFNVLARFLEQLPQGFRYAVEVRHPGWITDRFFELLRSHRVAFALVDSPWLPRQAMATTDFAYLRWLGDRCAPMEDFSRMRLNRSEDLEWWAKRISEMRAQGVDAYGYFNNHYAGHSPSSLQEFLDLYQLRCAQQIDTSGDVE